MKNDFMERCGFSQVQMNIARLYAAVPCDASAVKEVFSRLDFNALHSEESLVLSQAACQNGYAGVPSRLLARVRGILGYHAAKNAAVMCETAKLVGLLRDEGIPVLLCKGAAIKCLYGPNRVRHMWDADFAVPKRDYARAIELARSNGYEGLAARHSVDMRGASGNALDIHSVFMRELLIGGDDAVWKRAVPASFYGQEVLVPCQEDLVIQLLINAAFDFAQGLNPFKWVADMVNFLPGCEIDKLIDYAKELGVGAQVTFSLKILQPVLPELCDYGKIALGLRDKSNAMMFRKLRNLSVSYPRYLKAYRSKSASYIFSSLRAKWDEHSYLCGKRRLIYRMVHFPAFIKSCVGGKNPVKSLSDRLRRHREMIE